MGDGNQRKQGGANEGEGSRTADERHTRPDDSLQERVEAERDVENYRDEYERAEEAGRSRSAGDLEQDLDGPR
ncbi:MAG TPA: hypothetical protein VE964_00400 [Myxococcales bacterium]|nr:hypothetical protein [Myxococcales bacterium]